jgi:putative transcriptional regulator
MGEPRPLGTWRELRGWTQEQLAAEVGVSRVTITTIEKGDNTPSVTLAYAIADALGVPDRDIAWPVSTRYGPDGLPSKRAHRGPRGKRNGERKNSPSA